MKNKTEAGKIEKKIVITVIFTVILILGLFFFKCLSKIKLEMMKKDAINFSRVVSMNLSSFHNSENVYLGEVIDEKLMTRIKNPLGSGYCSSSESSVEVMNEKYYVTLKCGKFLIEKADFSAKREVDIYSLTEWKEEKLNETDEVQKFYNCEKEGKKVFPEYYEELYFVYQINKKYKTNYYSLESVFSTCEVISKEYYRTKEKMNS